MGSKRTEKKRNTFIKIPQTKTTVQQNIILGIGLCLMLVGLFLLVKAMPSSRKVFAFRPVILLGIGVVSLFMALAFTKNSMFIFCGIDFLLCGVISLLMDSGIIMLKMKEMWPSIVIASGISLLPAGFYRRKRIRTVYLFPALMLIILGTLFLLFSLHVFTIPLTKFIAMWWPIVIIGFGLFLVILFLWQQHHQQIFPYMQDDSLVSDEEDDEKQNPTGGTQN